MEEDTLKVHLETIVRVGSKFKALKTQVSLLSYPPPFPLLLFSIKSAFRICFSVDLEVGKCLHFFP